MSALANKHINHNIELSEAITDAQQAATPISVTARIDYILRFSKQAVLVVDDNTSNYTQLARQYLANLSQTSSNAVQDVNVAFVVASNKLNDIQMRCRLVEQLFANTLFDPEQSLAVSILRLAKQQKDVVTIVIEHAHALSLQLKYELCQLVDIANKTQIKINVVLFGQEQAAHEVSHNKSLFDKKVSIIEADTGQVIAIDNARFNSATPLLASKSVIRISLIVMMSIATLLLSWFFLTEHENFSLVGISSKKAITQEVKQITPKLLSTEEVKPLASKAPVKTAMASNDDIYLAILGEVNIKPPAEVKPAASADILQALAFSEQNIEAAKIAEAEAVDTTANEVNKNQTSKLETKAKIEKQELTTETVTSLPVTLNHQYFIGQKKGYVVQIAGFSDLTVLAEFIEEYKNVEYFSYQKSLNNQKFIVLTSQVFTNKAQAQTALSKLPKAIQQRGAFLKSVSIIKREINTVKG